MTSSLATPLGLPERHSGRLERDAQLLQGGLGQGRVPLEALVESELALDLLRRAVRLEAEGYRVRALAIPSEITPKNRLLLGEPLG